MAETPRAGPDDEVPRGSDGRAPWWGSGPASAAAPPGSSPVPEAAVAPARGLHGGLLQEASPPTCRAPDNRAVLAGAAAGQRAEQQRPGQRAGLEAWSLVLETLRGSPEKGVRFSPKGRKTPLSYSLPRSPIQRALGSEQPRLMFALPGDCSSLPHPAPLCLLPSFETAPSVYAAQ